ncbi:MAG: hypothetical protein JWO71_3117 [Candidatus Acidoferrum typicum]|nr:hypothetical protein [Candidatus Acidoferrum typicum]
MATIGELIINLNASTAAFVTELERVKNLSFDTAAQVQRSFSILGTAAVGMIGVAAGAFAEGVTKTVEWETHILHLAQSAGTSTEAISGLSLAAKMMGLEIDQVASALTKFDKQLLQAQLGNAKAQQNLSLLGLDPSQIKTSDDALLQLADHFAKLPDGAVKSGEAMMAFGKSGAAMVPLLNLGRQGLQDFMNQAKAMGLVITKDQAEAAERFEQNVTRMQQSLKGLWVEITNKTLPAMNDLVAAWTDGGKKTGFWEGVGGIAAILTQGMTAYGAYKSQGEAIIAQQEKMRAKVTALTADFAGHQKAVDALKKSIESLITSQQTQLATIGKTAEAVQEYKIRVDAHKLGMDKWAEAEIAVYRAQNTRLTVLQKIAEIDNQTRDEQKKNFLAARLALDLQDLDVLKQRADLAMQIDVSQFAPTSSIGAVQQTEAFTQAYQQQMSELEHSIATWGMTADQVTRYNMALLDSSTSAAGFANNVIALQDKLAHMQNVTAAWKEFENISTRTLDELIFSGKSLGDVFKDLVKQLGEMAIKWALFGSPSDKGNGGIFGSIFGGLKSIFGLASGGPVSAGQTVMVGEEGPELFTPSTSGYVIPNGASAAGAGVNITYQIDARGSSITEEQFRRSLAQSEGRAVQRALNMTRETQLRTA